MLTVVIGIVIGIIFIGICISNSLKEVNYVTSLSPRNLGRKPQLWGWRQRLHRERQPHMARGKKKGISENDIQILATILSAGLVDVDPASLQHLKDYRELSGGST